MDPPESAKSRGNVSLSVTYPHPPPRWKKTAKYAGIAAIIVVLAIVVISVVALTIIVGLLSDVASGMKKISAPLVCWHWLEARRKTYEGRTNPDTGQPYTDCEAAGASVSDAESGSPWSPCPSSDSDGDVSPEVYTYFVATQC